MFEIFKTVLLLSAAGASATLILLALKPLALRKFPAMWQRNLWIVAAVVMLLPFWRLVPRQSIERIAPQNVPHEAQTENTAPNADFDPKTVVIEDTPMEYREVALPQGRSVRLYDLAAYVWLGGACVFAASSVLSYAVFLIRKRRASVDLDKRESFERVKKELGIRRKIRVRILHGARSPMLVGTLFPVVYIPDGGMDADAEEMVFRHELTHYRHGDLLIKWFMMLVNAAHWFNPFAYLLTANISEACEVACDMAVIDGMDDAHRRIYMEMILNMLEKGR